MIAVLFSFVVVHGCAESCSGAIPGDCSTDVSGLLQTKVKEDFKLVSAADKDLLPAFATPSLPPVPPPRKEDVKLFSAADENLVATTPTLAPTRKPREHSKWWRPFHIRKRSPPEPSVDLVITLHCDPIDWIKDIKPELKDVLTVVILHKVSETDLKQSKCNPPIPETDLTVKYVRLPNAGRDGGSQFTYISRHYHTLATYTMFMQAGYHWFIGNWLPEAQGFSNNSAAVNVLVPMALQKKLSIVPVAPYLKQGGDPILFLDRSSNVDKEAQDVGTPRHIKKFDAATMDMFNQARDMLGVIFDMMPCDHDEEIVYVPGMQYLVQRDAILARPKAVWEGLEDMSLHCDSATYALERLPFHLFNSSKVAANPESWRKPRACPDIWFWDKGPIKYLNTKVNNPFLLRHFWEKQWGCDPLTSFLKARENRSIMAKIAAETLSNQTSRTGTCTWLILHDTWLTSFQREVSRDECLEACCSDASCQGVQSHAELDSQCYLFNELPQQVLEREDQITHLDAFDHTKPNIWSFLVKQK